MLNEGRLLRNEPLAEIQASNAVRVVVLDDPAPVVEALTTRGASVSVSDRTLEVVMDDADLFVMIRDILADTGVGLRSLGAKQATLEDVYLAVEEFTE
jgi:hypothetical protein